MYKKTFSPSQSQELTLMLESLKSLQMPSIKLIPDDISDELKTELKNITVDYFINKFKKEEQERKDKEDKRCNDLEKMMKKHYKEIKRAIHGWFDNDRAYKNNKINDYLFNENNNGWLFVIEYERKKLNELFKEYTDILLNDKDNKERTKRWFNFRCAISSYLDNNNK